jgi:predicted 2-oxoglutarate/Fe(II)-dependent dioxygenase YbiX
LSVAFDELAPAIVAARAFSPDEAAVLRAIAEETPGWSAAVINADDAVDPAVRDAEVLHAHANPRLTGMCHQRLLAITSERASVMAPEGVLGEMQFVRYAAGGGYVEHRDTPSDGGTTRVLSLVCYLNDDFDGGATTFAESGVRVRPQSGLVVAFAPQLLHAAEPVIAGTKYAITAWYHARPQ